MGWYQDRSARAARWRQAAVARSLRIFHRWLPADSGRVEVLGKAVLLHFWLERVCRR
jgi:hypothetical protein